MSNIKLYKGNCLVVLRTLPDESVDSIVTDPPYGLSSKEPDAVEVLSHWLRGDDYIHQGGGFMGKTWDSFVPGPSVWKEALRVLKPGGHLLCFAGTRTVDLMGMAIRIAGFEIRDQMQWLYGCLTDDAEVLTEHGWKRGIEVAKGERIAQWDSDSGEIELAPVLDTFRGPWDGPMVVFRNHDTDQMLTPNHRVYHRTKERVMVGGERKSHWTDWRAIEAAEISRTKPLRLPLAGEHHGEGIGGEDYARLLGWVWTEGGFDQTGSGVRLWQSSVNQANVDAISALLDNLVPGHKRYDRERTYKGRSYTETCWFFTGEVAQRVRADLPDKHPTYDLLWRMTLAEKMALWDAAMAGDGSGYHFFQKGRSDLEWAQTLLATMGQRGRLTMRSNRPDGSVTVTPRATTELQHRHLRVREDHYSGDVWCVRVPTGAFVARRNGQVFITGNSGFPKSMDVSKAIDKAAGAEREKVPVGRPVKRMIPGADQDKTGSWIKDNGREYQPGIEVPATTEAEQWEGWGTALKPAQEPIIVARKPFKGTVAANVLTHGTGAINIDATRISTGGEVISTPQSDPSKREGVVGTDLGITGAEKDRFQEAQRASIEKANSMGRWPANVLLGHHEDCVAVGTKKIKGIAGGYTEGSTGTMETVEAWDCHPDCAVRLLDEQTGTLTSGKAAQGKASGESFGVHTWPEGQVMVSYADKGGASRFFYCAKTSKKERNAGMPEGDNNEHPTVKPIDLMRYLVRLVTPPGGVVLDPYLGSGTTMIGASLEGFDGIGIDLDDDDRYLYISQCRIEHHGGVVERPEIPMSTLVDADQALAEEVIQVSDGLAEGGPSVEVGTPAPPPMAQAMLRDFG